MADFLLEVGLEEVPARMIASAEAELGRRVTDLLTRERLLDAGATVTTYSTPRRLAVVVEGVLAAQADIEEQLTGPSWAVAFKDGSPTKAAEAFAKKAGVDVSALSKVTTPKGEYIGASVKRAGRSAAEILQGDLPKEVLSIYWAKNMYWRAGKPERFVRPVRWVVALLDSDVVPVEIAGIAAGSASRGHRVLHGAEPVTIGSPKGYAENLRAAKVIVDVAERRQVIRKALDKVTRTVPGARWREDEALVETVTHLTEWPSAIIGEFEQEYLALPEEVLVTVMRDHQKYFAVEDANKKLAPHFLAVLNTEVDEEGQQIIRNGNARELRARFKDAQFFWDFDQKTPLAKRVESLKNVTFQKELGSYWDKTAANERIAKELAGILALKHIAIDSAALHQAVTLAKADLTTELVKEFTELQGIVGGLYARSQGLSEVVSSAIYHQYLPASGDDPIPPSGEGQLLGLVDRVQTIVAMFAIGLEPTGSRDPFALRRAANGIVKILAESELPLRVDELLAIAAAEVDQSDKAEAKLPSLVAFFKERLHFYLKDVRGFAYDVINAVLSAGSDDVRDAIARAEALTAVRGSEDFAAVSAAFKRIKNILKQAEEKKIPLGSVKDAKLATEAQQLADAAGSLAPRVAKLRQERAYEAALSEIATLRPTVDLFFDKVMVLDPDETVRGANLALIDEVLRNFSGIADFSEIVTS
ncbi:glycine--tRNA ligase subunit beta [Occallatibacter riparius]|uniref:Glycine--tRNA ligase beta subunit n=1 Tax=Occallatibacter riparius TaxID=1002689 RepID=A0A9J7BJY8_9BACT|nr:glycine--tRNA ligase subunit beta [Occallatibacter riparius]UWZ82867.1 glycine--tRNA ligase subunit beta [Occallatibacter riparius]